MVYVIRSNGHGIVIVITSYAFNLKWNRDLSGEYFIRMFFSVTGES